MDRWPIRAALLTVAVAAGLLHGARVAIGMPEVPAFARTGETTSTPERFERDSLRGSLWRPAGSIAERPQTSGLERPLWRPASSRANTTLASREP